jgi:hypothetical protein
MDRLLDVAAAMTSPQGPPVLPGSASTSMATLFPASASDIVGRVGSVEVSCLDLSRLRPEDPAAPQRSRWIRSFLLDFALLEIARAAAGSSAALPLVGAPALTALGLSGRRRCWVLPNSVLQMYRARGSDVNGRVQQRGLQSASVIDMMRREWDFRLAPVNSNDVHWALAALDITRRCCHFYDSYRARCINDVDARRLLHELQVFTDQVYGVNAAAVGEWDVQLHHAASPGVPGVPQQNGGSDCGMHVIAMMDCLAAGREWDFTSADLLSFRRQLAARVLRSGPFWP